jgi:beta-lactamase regulating signal transducer with metallopeptidase domain
MSELFLSVLNMSLTASYVILFVILLRLLLKKAPKFISYALWVAAAFRLLIPFSFESMFSLLPRNTNAAPIPHDIIYQQSPQINSGIEIVDAFVNKSLPAPTIGASVNPLQVYIEIGAYIWILGIIALLVYSLVSILILKRQLKSAELIEKNIFEAKNLKTPFVLGLIRPKIYLPMGLNVEERGYILLHEQTHIHRKDHIIKVLAFLILSVHWFNPLVWIAFILMSTDMELSCDERVLKEMKEDIKKPYANSLLSLATGRHILNGSPLAFGEGNVKGRIKNVLYYKKPRFWGVVALIIIATAVGIGLMANPKAKNLDGDANYTPISDESGKNVEENEPTKTLAPKGEVKKYTYQNLEIELTGVKSDRIETMLDDGGNEWKYTVITCYSGAKLTVIKADMSDPYYNEDGKAHPQWGIIEGEQEHEKRIKITDDFQPMEITSDLKGIFNLEASLYVFRFEVYSE